MEPTSTPNSITKDKAFELVIYMFRENQEKLNEAVSILKTFEKATDLWLPSEVSSFHVGEAQALHNLRRRYLTLIKELK